MSRGWGAWALTVATGLCASHAAAAPHRAPTVSVGLAGGLGGGICYSECGNPRYAVALTSLVSPNPHFAVGVAAERTWFSADPDDRSGSLEVLAGVLRFTSLPSSFVMRPYLQFGAGLAIAGASNAKAPFDDRFASAPALQGAAGFDFRIVHALHLELQGAGTLGAFPQRDVGDPGSGPPVYGGYRVTLGLTGVLGD